MYTLLALFFISLICITIMIWRRLTLIRSGQIQISDEVLFEITHLDYLKRAGAENIKKYGRALLVATLRADIKSSNYFRKKYEEAKIKLKARSKKKLSNGEKQEISKFLEIISDYKEKIREIKHQIKEEENNS